MSSAVPLSSLFLKRWLSKCVFSPVSDMQNEKHCSPENLSPNNKWQLYCARQSPGQLSVHRAASSDLYSMNWSADISLSLLGLQLVVYLQGRCPQIHKVCSSITEMQAWLSLMANGSSLGSREMMALDMWKETQGPGSGLRTPKWGRKYLGGIKMP